MRAATSPTPSSSSVASPRAPTGVVPSTSDASTSDASAASSEFLKGTAAAALAYERGTRVPETSLNGRRFVGIGYVTMPDGRQARQLILTEYSYTSNFHQEVSSPNRICAVFVHARSPAEERAVSAAIEAVTSGNEPRENPAYHWAAEHEIEPGLCVQAQREADGTLSNAALGWSLRASGSGVTMKAARWQNPIGETMIFSAEREVSR